MFRPIAGYESLADQRMFRLAERHRFRLRHAPRSDLEPGFDASRFSLRPVAVDTWGPFVFANRDLDAPPLAEFLGGLPGIVAAAGIDFDRMAFHERQEWEMQANWKAIVENYLECYHCPTAHPGFSKLIDVAPEAYRLSSDRWFSSLAAFAFFPIEPGRTMTVTDHFFGEDMAPAEIAEIQEFGNQVGMEDLALVESIQRAAASGGLEEGQLLLQSEHLIQHFQRLVEQALAGPAAG